MRMRSASGGSVGANNNLNSNNNGEVREQRGGAHLPPATCSSAACKSSSGDGLASASSPSSYAAGVQQPPTTPSSSHSHLHISSSSSSAGVRDKRSSSSSFPSVSSSQSGAVVGGAAPNNSGGATNLSQNLQQHPLLPPGVGAPMEVFNLRWDEYHRIVIDSFWSLFTEESLVDCTLVCSPTETVKVHRIVLSANSPYFRSLLASHTAHPHPIIILHDVRYSVLKMLITFMYSSKKTTYF
ncbi:Sex determination protein fruitless, partial [Orchesella cincta]